MHKIIKWVFLTLFCGLPTCFLQAQTEINSVEINIPSSRKFDEVMAVPNGFAVSSRPRKGKGWKVDVEYSFYNEELQFVRKVICEERREHQSSDNLFTDKYLHSIFTIPGSGLFINSMNVEDGSLIDVKVKIGCKGTIRGKVVVKDRLLVLLKEASANESVMYSVDYKTGESEEFELEIPGVKSKNIQITELQTLESGGYVVVAIEKTPEKSFNTHVVQFNELGDKMDMFTLKNRFSYKCDVTAMESGELLVSGSISVEKGRRLKGVYLAKCSVGGKIEADNVLLFSSIDGFMDYSPKKYKKGYQIPKLFTNVTNNGIMIWAEAFYHDMPGEYETGNTYFTHGFCAVFDLSGRLESTSTFEFNYDMTYIFYDKSCLKQTEIKKGEYILSNLGNFYAVMADDDDYLFFIARDDNSEVEPTELEEWDLDLEKFTNLVETHTILKNSEWELKYQSLDYGEVLKVTKSKLLE